MTSDAQWEFLKDEARLIFYLMESDIRYKATGGDLFRSHEEQIRKYNAGLSNTMESRHRVRQAIDLNFWVNGQYLMDKVEKAKKTKDPEKIKKAKKEILALLGPVGTYWESLNIKNRAGMFWESPFDPGHFERTA